MKEKKPSKCFQLLFQNYHFFSYISLLFFLYAFYSFYRVYITQNTKTIKPPENVTNFNESLPFYNISDDIQFSSFLLLALDGVSYHYLQPLLDVFGKNVQLYTTYNNYNKFTIPIFRTWLTGRDNIDFLPHSINEDTIIHCYKRRYGRRIILLGNIHLFRSAVYSSSNDYFTESDEFYNKKDISILRPFEPFLLNEERKRETFKKIKENNYSVLGYDDATDHVQHWQGFSTMCKNFSLSEELPKRMAEDIKDIKEFIDNNHNCVLIISSDHGHDEAFYENNIKSVKLPYLESFTPEAHYRYYDHGGYLTNNTGWWMFYSPLLSPSHRLINITDVASTWMKYISSTEIPSNNIGRPMNSMLYIRNEVKVKQQGLAQLWNLCQKSTKHCKGSVYIEGLEWKEGEVIKFEKERNERKERLIKIEKTDIIDKKLDLVKNIVSLNATEAFPYNLSFDEIRRISEGRDKEPRRKEKQNITTHYYYEYDMDEDGNLFDNLKEKNEKMNVSREEAKEIINRYELFVNESEILHNLLYETCIIIEKSDYHYLANNIKLLSHIVFYFSYFTDLLLFYLIVKNYFNKQIINKRNEHRESNKTTSNFLSFILVLSVIFYGRNFYLSFSRMKTMMEYLSQPEIHYFVFWNYDPFLPLYEKLANYITIYCYIIIFLILLKLLILYWKRKSNNKNIIINYSINKRRIFFRKVFSHIKSLLKSFFKPSFSSSHIYNFYIYPLLKLSLLVIFLPSVYPFIKRTKRFRRQRKKYNEYISTTTLTAFKIFRIASLLTFFDVCLSLLHIICYFFKGRKERINEEKEIMLEKRKRKLRKLLWDLFERLSLFIICYCYGLELFIISDNII